MFVQTADFYRYSRESPHEGIFPSGVSSTFSKSIYTVWTAKCRAARHNTWALNPWPASRSAGGSAWTDRPQTLHFLFRLQQTLAKLQKKGTCVSGNTINITKVWPFVRATHVFAANLQTGFGGKGPKWKTRGGFNSAVLFMRLFI